MANVIITGLFEPLYLADSRAKELQADMERNSLPKVVEIDGMMINNPAQAIKYIRLDSDQRGELVEEKIEDWSTPFIRTFLGDYEKIRDGYVAKLPEFIPNDVLGNHREGVIKLFEDQGAISFDGKYWAVSNIFKFVELEKKERALSVLKDRRYHAKKLEDQAAKQLSL